MAQRGKLYRADGATRVCSVILLYSTCRHDTLLLLVRLFLEAWMWTWHFYHLLVTGHVAEECDNMQGTPFLQRGRLRHGDRGLVVLSRREPLSLLPHACMSLLCMSAWPRDAGAAVGADLCCPSCQGASYASSTQKKLFALLMFIMLLLLLDASVAVLRARARRSRQPRSYGQMDDGNR